MFLWNKIILLWLVVAHKSVNPFVYISAETISLGVIIFLG